MSGRSKSGVASSVRIKTCSAPAVTVLSHRTGYRNNCFRTSRNIDDSSVNDVLKSGGSLPLVIPDGEIYDNGPQYKQPHSLSIRKQTNSNVEQDVSSKVAPLVPSCIKVISIDQKVQMLGRELSDVQQDLNLKYQKSDNLEAALRNYDANCTTEILNEPIGSHRLLNLSCKDYCFIVTEMNENVHIQPYDPKEFTVGAKLSSSSKSSDNEPIKSQTNLLCSSEKAEILCALQNELAKWREAQEIIFERGDA